MLKVKLLVPGNDKVLISIRLEYILLIHNQVYVVLNYRKIETSLEQWHKYISALGWNKFLSYKLHVNKCNS